MTAHQTRPQTPETRQADIWLLVAPVKRARLDYLAQKATEMGATRLVPVITRRTQGGTVNLERLRANAQEAAEQCGILQVPEIMPPVRWTMRCKTGMARAGFCFATRRPKPAWGFRIGRRHPHTAGGLDRAGRRLYA